VLLTYANAGNGVESCALNGITNTGRHHVEVRIGVADCNPVERERDVPALGREAAKRIPHAKLIEFPNDGHSPQIQSTEEFHAKLLAVLVKD
jgi:pimeloyl-ACP methyl ester carboxylesterase